MQSYLFTPIQIKFPRPHPKILAGFPPNRSNLYGSLLTFSNPLFKPRATYLPILPSLDTQPTQTGTVAYQTHFQKPPVSKSGPKSALYINPPAKKIRTAPATSFNQVLLEIIMQQGYVSSTCTCTCGRGQSMKLGRERVTEINGQTVCRTGGGINTAHR